MYTFLFYVLCKRGWIIEAETLFREMKYQSFFVDKLTYTSLIDRCCNNKKIEMTMRVYLRMLKTSCEPDTYTCNTLIHGFAKVDLFDKT